MCTKVHMNSVQKGRAVFWREENKCAWGCPRGMEEAAQQSSSRTRRRDWNPGRGNARGDPQEGLRSGAACC